MLVSILIPTYNQAALIERAIKSALMQDYPQLEVVVLDDCSSDDTFERANKITDPRLKVLRNEHNIGRVANYHRLLYQYCRGHFAVNLDGDDYYTATDFITEAVSRLKQHPNLVFYQATIKALGPGHEFVFRHKLLQGSPERILSGLEYFMNFYSNEYFGHLATVYRVSIAKETGFYLHDCLSADAESMLRLSLSGDVCLHNYPVGVWSIHQSNESSSALRKNDQTVQMLCRIRDFAEAKIGNSKADEWFSIASDTNFKSYLSLLYKSDFQLFLRTVAQKKYWNSYVGKLIIKRILNR